MAGKVFGLQGALPGGLGRTWTFMGGSHPTADGQVTCAVPGHPGLTPSFTHKSRRCGSKKSTVAVVVKPVGATCSAQLQVGGYAGERTGWAVFPYLNACWDTCWDSCLKHSHPYAALTLPLRVHPKDALPSPSRPRSHLPACCHPIRQNPQLDIIHVPCYG
jgi:hypothetical protein